jgi:hypothetical protein
MSEYLNPVISVNDHALASMRAQGIERITLDRADFNRAAELVGRDTFEAGELNLAFGGVIRRFGGAIKYDDGREYREILQANGNSIRLDADLPLHDPAKARESGFHSTWPVPKEWNEAYLAQAAVGALRMPPSYLRNTLIMSGAFTGPGALGGFVLSHEYDLPVVPYTIVGGGVGFFFAGVTMISLLNWTSMYTHRKLMKEASSLRPFRIVPTSQ